MSLMPVEAELGERWRQRLVEDELLDEDRRLEQGVGLAGVVGEVLVEVAEEAGVECRVGEVMDQLAAGVGGTPEVDERCSPLGTDVSDPDWIVRLVDERLARGLRSQNCEGLAEPVATVVRWVLPEVRREVLLRPCRPVARTRDPADRNRGPIDPGARQQVVVLAEAHEGHRDQPRDSGLVDLVVAPHHPGVAGALAPAGLGVLLLQAGAPAVGLVIRASAEVGLDQLELGLEVLEQGGGLDHGV